MENTQPTYTQEQVQAIMEIVKNQTPQATQVIVQAPKKCRTSLEQFVVWFIGFPIGLLLLLALIGSAMK